MNRTATNARIVVLGAGSWGTALALLMSRNGYSVNLWDIDSTHVDAMIADGENTRHLPGIPFPSTITPVADLVTAVDDASHVLLVVPSHAFRATLSNIKANLNLEHLLLAWGTKGLDPERSMLLSDVVAEIIPEATRAVISGPSFAKEVASSLPTALTVAADHIEAASEVASWLRNDFVRIYTNSDLPGVQLGGAIKNVMAVAAGISDGLGFGSNARAALITRGLAEMNRLGVALGGRDQTFMGLTGVGDLVLTCTDDQSRNRRAGIGLGQGKTVEEVRTEIGQEIEGLKTVHELYAMAERLGVDMPITEQVYQVIYGGRPPVEAVKYLINREPKSE